MTRTALLVGFVSIALVSGARAAAGGPDAAPPLDRRVVTRAIFLSLPECADDRATLDRAIDLLPRLGYENLAREARDVVGEEFDRLRALRLQWLTQALEELERQQRRMPKNNPATQTMMSISLEFKLPPPIALHPDCDSVRIQYGDCRQEIEILKAAIADIEQIQVTLFRERVCKPIWDLIRAKGPVLEQNRELNPNTRYDVLRRAVFLRLAVAGVDAVVLDNALAWIGTNYGAPWIDQERAKLLAELPRLRRLKLRWLKEVVLPGILPSGSVAITIPREVWVEDYKEAYPTDEYFSRDSVPALEYEMRVLETAGQLAQADRDGYFRKALELSTAESLVNRVRSLAGKDGTLALENGSYPTDRKDDQGRAIYSWTVYVRGCPEVLKQVESVRYLPSPATGSAARDVVEAGPGDNSGTGFGFQSSGSEPLDIRALVTFKDGRTVTLGHRLHFD